MTGMATNLRKWLGLLQHGQPLVSRMPRWGPTTWGCRGMSHRLQALFPALGRLASDNYACVITFLKYCYEVNECSVTNSAQEFANKRNIAPPDFKVSPQPPQYQKAFWALGSKAQVCDCRHGHR